MATPGEVELKSAPANTVLNIVAPTHESLLIGRRGQTAESHAAPGAGDDAAQGKGRSLVLVVDVADYHGRAEERFDRKSPHIGRQSAGRRAAKKAWGPLAPLNAGWSMWS